MNYQNVVKYLYIQYIEFDYLTVVHYSECNCWNWSIFSISQIHHIYFSFNIRQEIRIDILKFCTFRRTSSIMPIWKDKKVYETFLRLHNVFRHTSFHKLIICRFSCDATKSFIYWKQRRMSHLVKFSVHYFGNVWNDYVNKCGFEVKCLSK